jgi:homoserine O-succinyltransferase
MPVLLDRKTSGHVMLGCEREISASDLVSSRSIDLALVNNMPDSALEGTERQFAELLAAASGDTLVRLKLFSLPGVPRAETARRYLGEAYSPIDSLWNSRPDALIVTGTEPRAAALTDEPYWSSLSRIVDWAQYATISTIWSCLAAHAAVLRTDGISRHLLREKRSGVFECTSLSDHPMTAGMPRQFSIPHSRCNDLDQDELTACGYTVLSRSPQAGVDSFVKRTRSTFVYFQGHPEYDSGTLFREYRRDVARFLSGERETYPAMPKGYFADDAKYRLTTFHERALAARSVGLLADFPAVEQEVANTWRAAATQIYRNWLVSILVEKERRPNLTTRIPSQRSAHSAAPHAAANVIAIERNRIPSFGPPAAGPARSATKRSQSAVTTPAGRPKA